MLKDVYIRKWWIVDEKDNRNYKENASHEKNFGQTYKALYIKLFHSQAL